MSRTRWNRCLLLSIGVEVACVLFTAEVARAEVWKAGTARVKITPDQFMWMAGYGSRNHPAEGLHNDLWVRALALEDASGQRGVLISFDLIGMGRSLSQQICQMLEREYALTRAQVALCFSHTHSGPVVGESLGPLHYHRLDRGQQQLIEQYAQQLPERVSACVSAALSDLQPCQLSWGSGDAAFAVNRRNNSEPDVPQLRTEHLLKGPQDHVVPVLAVRNATGRLKAVAFGYACHATVLDEYKWCGDYPGFAAEELEARHEGCVALFWAGCGADQNPLPRRQLQLAREYGSQLAAAVSEVLSGEMQDLTGPLHVTYREVPLALDTLPTRADLEKSLESQDPYVRARAELLLTQILDHGALESTYPYPVGVWQFADQIEFVFLGGEVVVDFALRLKEELHGCRTWVAGYANDVMAYIPSERVLREGRYEGADAMVYYGLPASWAPGVEQTIVDAVHAAIK